jgi:hypothetical protein
MDVKPRTLDKGSLWLLTIAPTIWAAHLLLSYITAAIWCARYAERNDPLNGIRTAIAWYTVVALVGITIIGWEGFRRHSYSGVGPSTRLGAGPSTSLGGGGTEASTHDLDSPEDRHRFLGFATLLLSGLSAVAVLYAALAAMYFDTCL